MIPPSLSITTPDPIANWFGVLTRIDTTAGPILLRTGAHVHAFTRLVGPLYVGHGSSVTTDRIAASSIGDTCKVHGEMSNTIVTLSLFDALGNATFGCFIINPADFTVSKNLQTARVHTTVTADEVCPGFGSPVTGKSDPNPLAGGGGGGTGLPLPISLDVTWTGLGVTSTSTDRNTFKCLNYSTQFSGNFRSSDANASGTMSAINGTVNTSSGVVSSSDMHANIKGTPAAACFPQ